MPQISYNESNYESFTPYIEELLSYDYNPVVDRTYPDTSVDVFKDSTGKSETIGEYEELQSLFQDRLDKMRPLLANRRYDYPVTDLKNLENKAGEYVVAIGLVRDVFEAKSGNMCVILEDSKTDVIAVCTDEAMFEDVEEILPDTVIAIEGKVPNDSDGVSMFLIDLHYPDIPSTNSYARTEDPVKSVFISDIHVGAKNFAEEKWFNFVDWVRQTPDISYLIIAGDLVEGIGIFPEQKEELEITNIHDQYQACADLFKAIPDDIAIVSCTGNHDAIRVAEPQPALEDNHQEMFGDNVTITGNPSTVKIHNTTTIELYHGASIHDITENLPQYEEEDPAKPMTELLKRRHLAPVFGNNARIVPEVEDYHVINRIPDVLHSGHLHTFGNEQYRKVRVMNTGGWMYQTSYQERLNINPVVGVANEVDLSTGVVQKYTF
jgi:DNA polymerase II small subunit